VGLARLAPSPAAALRNAMIVLMMPLLRPLLQPLRRTLPVHIAADGRVHIFHVDCMGDVQVLYEVWGWRQYDLPSLAEATTIVDAGANVGASVAFFRSRRPEAIIHAYEPDPTTFAKLERNVSGLSGVILHRQAIADHDGVAVLYASANTWDSSLVRGTGAPVAVPCRRLRTALREAGLRRVDLLKLDIEGAEFDVLLDEEALDSTQALVAELHFDFVPDRELRDVLGACAGFNVAVSGDSETRMMLVGQRNGGGALDSK
jgi:FkbM family methyltransferase